MKRNTPLLQRIVRFGVSVVLAFGMLPAAPLWAEPISSEETTSGPFEPVVQGDPSGSMIQAEQDQIDEPTDKTTIVAVPKEGVDPEAIEHNVENIDESLGAFTKLDLVENPSPQDREIAVTMDIGVPAGDAAIDKLEQSGLYESVDYEHYYSTMALPYTSTPNDSYFTESYSWGLKSGWGARFNEVWPSLSSAASPTSVSVAVIDTGFRMNHPDKGANIVAGYDFGDNDSDVNPPTSTTIPVVDRNHGTFTAGIIAAETNNSIGVSGAAWDTRVVVYKVINSTNGSITSTALINALNDAVSKGIKVVNISLGSSADDANLKNAVISARRSGTIVVCASGNYANAGNPIMYPAAYPEALSVGSLTASGTRASSSTYNQYLDLMAPGENIRGLSNYSSSNTAIDYSVGSGTSYAAPYVAAACALMYRAVPDMNAEQIEDVLIRSAQDVSSYGYGWDIQTGYGALNVRDAYVLATGATLFDDTHSSITYTGWASEYASVFYGGSAHRSYQSGSTATFKVTGTEFHLIGVKTPSCGILDIYIDGASTPTKSLDCASSSVAFQQDLGVVGGLSANAPHTVLIKTRTPGATVAGFEIDRIDVYGDNASISKWAPD